MNSFWQDPDFNPKQSTFYRVRVIEVESPRWAAYDKARFGEDMPESISLNTQERAYSLPVWYEGALVSE